MSITYDRYDAYARGIVAFSFCAISHYVLAAKKFFLIQKNISISNHEYELAILLKKTLLSLDLPWQS